MSVTTAEQPQAPATVIDPRQSLLRRVLKNPLGLICSVILLLIVLFGLLAPLLAPFDPNLTKLELTNASPFSSDFVLGGDQAGRDILSRLMYATRGTLEASVVVLVVSLVLGVSTGLIAGYFAGFFDIVSDWIANAILALPAFVLLIALYTIIGPSILVAMAVFGVLIAPSYYRLVRSLVRNIRNELYIDAAKVAGLSDFRIVSRHVLRAVRAPIIVQSAFVLGAGIAIQAGLEFLGLGDPTEASWGGMLNDAFNNLYIAKANVIWPAVLITLTILVLVLLGNVVRDILQTAASQNGPLKASVIQQLRSQYTPTHLPTSSTPPAAATPMADAAGTALIVKGLVIAYPNSKNTVKEVVSGVDLAVSRGEIHGLVGESGSGKSQTAFSILGILPKEAVILAGSITYYGHELLGDSDAIKKIRGRRIAYVPQEPMSNLDPSFTIGQQLTFGLTAVKKIGRRQAKQELLALLERVGIKDSERVFGLYPHQISGGMAQRVLIAGAIAGDPELIIADEPTTALDVTVQADVLDLLRELQRERNLGMILVSHNLGVIADICDRVSVMQDGVIVESNTMRDLFAHPQHEYTRMLLGSTLDSSIVREPLAAASPRTVS